MMAVPPLVIAGLLVFDLYGDGVWLVVARDFVPLALEGGVSEVFQRGVGCLRP